MRAEKACRRCGRVHDEKKCPECGSEETTTEYVGVVIVLDPKNSWLAQKLGLRKEGKYAIGVA